MLVTPHSFLSSFFKKPFFGKTLSSMTLELHTSVEIRNQYPHNTINMRRSHCIHRVNVKQTIHSAQTRSPLARLMELSEQIILCFEISFCFDLFRVSVTQRVRGHIVFYLFEMYNILFNFLLKQMVIQLDFETSLSSWLPFFMTFGF